MAYVKINKLSFRNFFVLIATGLLFAASVGPLTHAASNSGQQTVSVTIGPVPDLCPNIPGTQATIPSGMLLDINGNCYTPTPPPPPAPVVTDLCSNLAGVQSSLPAGYYRTTAGTCYAQPIAPAQPIDVCPNLEGTQAAVPDTYYLETNGNCTVLPPPTDMCPNIPGPQAVVPDGMKLENDICFTPEVATPATPQNPATPSEPLKNVPEFLQPIVQPLVNLIPENVKTWLRSLPQEVAKTVPYYVFILVAILAIVPILQSIREAIFVRQLLVLLKRERDIAEQKDNFVTLASHYLRTPLTLMKSGLDTILSLKELPPDIVQPLNIHLNALDADIGSVLGEVEQNDSLKNIAQPVTSTSIPPVWRSTWFWGPIASSILITVIANFLLGVVGNKEIAVSDTFFHFLIAAIAFFILYLGVRNLYLQRKLKDENQALVDNERIVDEARNSFIAKTTRTLQEGLEPIDRTKTAIEGATSSRFFTEGYERIEAILSKFLLLSQVQTGVERETQVFDLHDAINQMLVTYQTAIAAKRITVTNTTSLNTPVQQNRTLFNFVLGSILDNAIKFNQEGGSIEISATPNNKLLSLKVADNGIGIDETKLDQLFKPFSRATSSIEFNYEGLGFSLFLDKIIMDYTGGAISAQSTSNVGTELVVTTPVATRAL